MQTLTVLAAAWLTVLAAQTSVRPSDRFRDEFKLRPETARISQVFSGDAWIVLLYATRQGSNNLEVLRDNPVDTAMEALRSEAKTDGEWLFWYRLNNYSIAKQLTQASQTDVGLMSMLDPEACRVALMAANRSRVMVAGMPACELVASKMPVHKP